MRKRFFFPLFVLFVFFPIIIYLLSYTRFFNGEVRRILVSAVDSGTNARLHIGEIHGTIFGTFRIDGAALLYDGQPIAMVDTVVVSSLPLTLVTRTIEVARVKLVHPRFNLVRYTDGTLNVDHIGRPGGKPGGKFDWTILAKSVEIRDGEMSVYDSTAQRGKGAVTGRNVADRFDPSRFEVRRLNLAASADLSGDNLTVNVGGMSLVVDPPGMKIDSLKFDFFTSPAGTEISGFRLKTGRSIVQVDLALNGQDLLDSLNENTIRKKYFTANVKAEDVDVNQINGFVQLPINTPSRFDLNLFASGTLDTISVKQCLVSTDSSVIPLAAGFRNIIDSTMTMTVTMNNAEIDMAELSSVLGHLGVPDLRRLGKMTVSASAVGPPKDLAVTVSLTNGKTYFSGESRLNGGGYDGSLAFRGINIDEILNRDNLETSLSGSATFSLLSGSGTIPDGTVSVVLDSSMYDRTSIGNAAVKVTSASDSIGANFNILTSGGNLDGQAGLDLAHQSYAGDISFSEVDLARFVHISTLHGDLTGRLIADGAGFNIDSLRTQFTLLTDHSSIDSFNIGTSAFTVEVNTLSPERRFQIKSPYFDASLSGHFVPHEFPSQIGNFVTALVDTFGTKFTGKVDTSHIVFSGLPEMNAKADVEVKDARFLGMLMGNTLLSGSASAHVSLAADGDSVTMAGFLSADTMNYARDSVNIFGSRLDVGFNFRSNPGLAVWDSGSWSTDARIGSLDIGPTRLAAERLNLNYDSGDSSGSHGLSLDVIGKVDSLVDFNVDAAAALNGGEFSFVTDTLGGHFYGIPLLGESPVHIKYSPETFSISPATFRTDLGTEDSTSRPEITVNGSYSLQTGADLKFHFQNFALRSIQKIARLDTNTLKLAGNIDGSADLNTSSGAMILSANYSGKDAYYNGSVAKLIKGNIALSGQVMSIDAELSKQDDSASYALRLKGTVPLVSGSASQLHLNLAADSLDVSFLAPFLPGIQDFGGILSGNMSVSGKYSSPEMKGKLVVDSGRIRLAANEVDYLFDGTIIGDGDKLRLAPLTIRNVVGQTGGTMIANGYITIGQNTIQEFNLTFDGSLLILNSSARKTLQGIYGTAIVGSGTQGLRLQGSLQRPMLLGSLNIQSADLTLLHLQRSESVATQEIIYHFPERTSEAKSPTQIASAAIMAAPQASGSFIDSLRYDVEIETKDNVNLRMVFDPTTNEELSAVLGGRLHMSNLSGSMELIGDVSVQNNSYYNFYGRHFAATGKLHFTGNPLNPMLDITAQYTGEHADTSSSATGSARAQSVVVQLGISGTFDKPNPPDISMTVDGVPYQGDVQTNAISFILTNEFADELTSPVKRSVADNLWTQAGSGILTAGTSILSGALTSLFSKEFSFIRSAELRYSSISDLGNPDVAITTQFGKATIRLGGQVFSDINNTDVSMDYPLADVLGNMLYLQLSHKIALNNRTYFQRETINALKLFYQLSF